MSIDVDSLHVTTNMLWRWIGVRAVPHLPCSFDCAGTIRFGEQFLALGRRLGYAEEIGWIEEILSWPVEWSALHGIAEVKTPVLKMITATDATPYKYTVQIKGEKYPSEGATGLYFPYRKPAAIRLAIAQKRHQQLEDPLSR